jgi:hypothetical protein
MAHKAAVNKSQHFRVAGVRVWVPVSAKEQSAEEQPVTLVQLKPPKPQPKKQQAAPSHKITSFFLPR